MAAIDAIEPCLQQRIEIFIADTFEHDWGVCGRFLGVCFWFFEFFCLFVFLRQFSISM